MSGMTLDELGWRESFRADIADDVLDNTPPVRICDVHRGRIHALGVAGEVELHAPPDRELGAATVGDWVLHEPGSARVVALLPRATLVQRAVAAGRARQAIAANVDTLMIVTACDADFNPARLERYLALALASETLPLIVLTKTDLVADVGGLRTQASRLSPLAAVVDVDAREAVDLERLWPWLGHGQTVALVGSSGVGKSTLLAGLTATAAVTGAVRDSDGKGRHTTTSRSLRAARPGGWLIDTPGMRELGLGESADGIDAVFDDVAALIPHCRFPDCKHGNEPGCAVLAALESGELDPERLARWKKLRLEDLHHSASVAETHERDRRFGRRIRDALGAKRDRRTDR